MASASLAENASDDMIMRIMNNLQRDDKVPPAVCIAEISRSTSGIHALKVWPSFGSALESIWEEFSFSFRPRSSNRIGYLKRTRSDGGMTSQDVCNLLQVYSQEQHHSIPSAPGAMKGAGRNVNPDYLSNELLSFVKAVLKHEVPALIPDDDFETVEPVSEFVFLILVTYIRQTVPSEPLKPKDWSLPYRGCQRCDECRQVDKFMADSKQTKIEIRANEQRRRHLEAEYEGGNYEEKDFNVKIIKDKTPYAWVCTKAHKRFNKLAAEWRRKMQEVHSTLDNIGGKKHMALKAYLGESYDTIASCRPEDLPYPQDSDEDAPLAEVNESFLNSRKRNTDVVECMRKDCSKAK